jgi:hypothetical protein
MAVEDDQYPPVNLSELDEPPVTWQHVRSREMELKKSFSLNELRVLSEYHTHGFICQKSFTRKQDYIDLLHKILYYTQTGLADEAAFTETGIICAGPVGPGTLPEEFRSARGLPIWHLTQQAALEKIQPHQSLRSERADAKSRPKANSSFRGTAPEIRAYSQTEAAADRDSDYSQQPILPANAIASKTPSVSPKTADLGQTSNASNPPDFIVIADDDDDDDDDETLAGAKTPIEKTQRSIAEEAIWSLTTEKVRKAIVASAYSGLETVPDAFLYPQPFLLATKPEELLRRLIHFNIASSHVNVQFSGEENYAIVENGTHLRYCGRGPRWHANSCYWDSIIVSCRFLNAGFTYLDRGTSPDFWESALTTIERAFLDVLRMDWDFFDRKASIEQRGMFLELFHREWSGQGGAPKPKPIGEMDSPAARWNDVAGPFNQFSFQAHQRRQPCACQNRPVSNNSPAEMRFITPPYQESDANGVTVTDLLQRWSHYVLRHCQTGAKATTNVIHGNLPLRVVLQITSGTRILDHTSQNLSFEYTRIEPGSGKEIHDRVSYRWLGGVYSSGSHFRVYWNDSKTGAKAMDSLRVYDGMQATGAILGDVPPASPSEPIPKYWTKHCPPLLFYEQVIYPDPIALEAAQSTITEILATQPNRSVFPHTFPPVTANDISRTMRTTALQPLQLPAAIFRVEGPITGFHNTSNRPPPIRESPPSTPRLRRSKRISSRPISKASPSTSSHSPPQKKRSRPQKPKTLTPSPLGAQNNPVSLPSSPSRDSSGVRKRRKGGTKKQNQEKTLMKEGPGTRQEIDGDTAA